MPETVNYIQQKDRQFYKQTLLLISDTSNLSWIIMQSIRESYDMVNII